MNPISGSGFEGFIRDPTANVQHPLGKVGMTALNVLFGLVTLGTVHIGFAIKHHFTTKREMVAKARALTSLKMTDVSRELLGGLRLQRDLQPGMKKVSTDLVKKINEKMFDILQFHERAKTEGKRHVYSLTDTHNLIIGANGRIFLEDLSQQLGKGTSKIVYNAFDLFTGEELVSLRYHGAEEKPVLPAPPDSQPRHPVLLAPVEEEVVAVSGEEDQTSVRPSDESTSERVEIGEPEEEGTTSFGSRTSAASSQVSADEGTVPKAAGQLAKPSAQPAFMAMFGRKKVQIPNPPQGTPQQNERGLAFGSQTEVQREFQVIRELKGSPGIVQTREITVYDSTGASQGEEKGLLQARYDGDLDKIKPPGEEATDLVKAENRLKRMELLAGAIEGMRVMHEKGFIHRDIKPGNIMFRTNPSTRQLEGALSDFGTVCLQYNDKQMMGYAGTPRYSSPELSIIDSDPSKAPELTPKSDIWSMGVTMYRVLCEQTQVEGGAQAARMPVKAMLFESIFGVQSAVDQNVLASISRLHPSRKLLAHSYRDAQEKHNTDLQEMRNKGPLEGLIADCLELDPAKRPTAAQLNERLQALIAQQGQQVETLRAGESS